MGKPDEISSDSSTVHVDAQALREGLDRAQDLFKLHRLSVRDDAERLLASVFANFGMVKDRRFEMVAAVRQMLPIAGEPMIEGLMMSSMCGGILVGLMIADATLGGEADAIPDCLPPDI